MSACQFIRCRQTFVPTNLQIPPPPPLCHLALKVGIGGTRAVVEHVKGPGKWELCLGYNYSGSEFDIISKPVTRTKTAIIGNCILLLIAILELK